MKAQLTSAPADKDRAQFISIEQHFQGGFSKRVIHTLWQAYQPYRRASLALILIGILGRGAVLLNANVIGIWVDSLCTSAPCPTLPGWAHNLAGDDYLQILLALTVFGFLATAYFWNGIAINGIRTIARIHDEAVLRTSRAPMRFLDTTPLGRIFARYSSDFASLTRTSGGPSGDLLGQAVDMLLMAILILMASPWYLPIIVITILLNYGLYKLNRPRLRRERRDLTAARGPSYAHFAETVQGYATIKVFSRQRHFRERFLKLIDQLNYHKARSSLLHNAYVLQMNCASALLFLGTALTGIILAQNNLSSVGSVGVAITFVTMITQSIQRFFDVVVMFEEAMTGAERLDDYLHRPLEKGAKLPAESTINTGQPQHCADELKQQPIVASLRRRNPLSLEIDKLDFRYHEQGPWILKDCSLRLKGGEHAAIVGRTGAGKSSIIQALFFLYPHSGRITVGDVAVSYDPDRTRQLSIDDIRSLIGYIPQNPTIFRACLRDNVTRDRSVSDEKVLDALTKSGLGSWLAQLGSDPLSHMLDEKGGNLSAGQRQLICMARCIIQDTPIVVMDEATSAVDPATEELVMKTLQTAFAEKTVLLIAHRLSTVERCDRIFWLRNGRIDRDGPPAQLLPMLHAEDLPDSEKRPGSKSPPDTPRVNTL